MYVGLWCLTSLSTLFQLYRGGQFHVRSTISLIHLFYFTFLPILKLLNLSHFNRFIFIYNTRSAFLIYLGNKR